MGSLIERVGSPHASQLASPSSGIHSLSGTPAQLQTMQIIVRSPSNSPASGKLAPLLLRHPKTQVSAQLDAHEWPPVQGQRDTCVTYVTLPQT
jgi:hypothetical protein